MLPQLRMTPIINLLKDKMGNTTIYLNDKVLECCGYCHFTCGEAAFLIILCVIISFIYGYTFKNKQRNFKMKDRKEKGEFNPKEE